MSTPLVKTGQPSVYERYSGRYYGILSIISSITPPSLQVLLTLQLRSEWPFFISIHPPSCSPSRFCRLCNLFSPSLLLSLQVLLTLQLVSTSLLQLCHDQDPPPFPRYSSAMTDAPLPFLCYSSDLNPPSPPPLTCPPLPSHAHPSCSAVRTGPPALSRLLPALPAAALS